MKTNKKTTNKQSRTLMLISMIAVSICFNLLSCGSDGETEEDITPSSLSGLYYHQDNLGPRSVYNFINSNTVETYGDLTPRSEKYKDGYSVPFPLRSGWYYYEPNKQVWTYSIVDNKIIIPMCEKIFTISGNSLLLEGTNYIYLKWDTNSDADADTGSGSTDNTESLIAKNIKASVAYRNYFFDITITTTLDKDLPGKKLEYGADFGIYEKNRTIINYDTYAEAEKQGDKFIIHFSIFDNDADYGFYVRQYEGLLELQKTEELDKDQRHLLSILTQRLKDKEAEIKSRFEGRLYVKVNGIQYNFKTFYAD